MTRRREEKAAARRTYTRLDAHAATDAFESYVAAEVAVHATEASLLAYNALYRPGRERAGGSDILDTARKAMGPMPCWWTE